MEIGITKLRQDLFRLVDGALAGDPLSFVYKGVVFRVTPDAKPSKLGRLTGEVVVAPKRGIEDAGRELMREMEHEWTKDWAEL